jgi:hypothetical protein
MDLLLKYDSSVLTFLSASVSGTRVEDWEKYDVIDLAGDGMVRLDARANLPGSDAVLPLAEGDGSVLKLNFFASSDLGYAGRMVRIDYAFLDTPVAHYWENQSPRRLYVVGKPYDLQIGIGIMINKNKPVLRAKMNAAILSITKSDTYAELLKTFFPLDNP